MGKLNITALRHETCLVASFSKSKTFFRLARRAVSNLSQNATEIGGVA
ncbi:hypothetical protein [Paraburkholderia sp. GAS32]